MGSLIAADANVLLVGAGFAPEDGADPFAGCGNAVYVHTGFDPGYMGDSVGHWEGDTLVVDTIGFNDKTTLDMGGMPHSDAMHVIERIRRIDDNTLEDLITVDDPKTFTKPWTQRMRYKTSNDVIQEDFCDNNKDAPADNQTPWSSHK